MGTGAGLERSLEGTVQDLERKYYRQGLGRLSALPVSLMPSDEMWKLSLAGPLCPLIPQPTACACLSRHLPLLCFQVCRLPLQRG